MLTGTSKRPGGPADLARADLTARLQARSAEIEQALLTRVFAVSGTPGEAGPEYVAGLRDAVSAALDYSLAILEFGEERSPPVPVALLAQGRLAARSGVCLDAVLRRYFAGYSLLSDFIVEEVEAGGFIKGASLQDLLRTHATLLDRIVAAVTEEYKREASSHPVGAGQRSTERVKRLLDGELIDTSELAYDFDGHHLGLIARGPGAEGTLRELAAALNQRLLLIREDEEVWAWLGSRRSPDLCELSRLIAADLPHDVTLAVGELGRGLAGWRLTHQQARATMTIALVSPQRHVRYSEVALLVSMLQDELLATSLRELYLDPLSEERDGGETLRETLRAYFAAERNVTSAAARLGVNRRTVTSRLRMIEARIGRPLGGVLAEVEVALRLEDMKAFRRNSPPIAVKAR